MNKTDEKCLKRHPRYRAIVAAKATLDERLAAAKAAYDAEVMAARAAYVEAAPEMNTHAVNGIAYKPLDEQVMEALRPRGDKVRVMRLGFVGREEVETACEVESVTPTTVSLVGHSKPFRRGHARHSDNLAYRIHSDDLAKLAGGGLMGWRQKPWR